jgi:cytoskeletal protein CcmA (bactofilin family)
MDENTDLTNGKAADFDGTTPEPKSGAEGFSATPVNEPALSDSMRVAHGFWPSADSMTPVPASLSSNGTSAPSEPEAQTDPFFNTPAEHIPAASLIDSSPQEDPFASPTRSVAPVSQEQPPPVKPPVEDAWPPLQAEPAVPLPIDSVFVSEDVEEVTSSANEAPSEKVQDVVFDSQSPIVEAIEAEAEAAIAEAEAAKQAMAEQLAVTSPDQLAQEPLRPGSIPEEPSEAEEEPVEMGISVITREATVLGDIITEGHIDIVGRVKGNIDAKGDVAIHGIVRGDIGGSKIGLYSCRVKGNLDAGLGVIVDDSSVIGGDVKTKNIIFDGKVKGNIEADNVVVLRSHSYCLGDVSAASLAVEPGAILNGKVRTFVSGDLEAPFDEVL